MFSTGGVFVGYPLKSKGYKFNSYFSRLNLRLGAFGAIPKFKSDLCIRSV